MDERHGGAFLLYNVAAAPPEATATAGADSNANPVAAPIAMATASGTATLGSTHSKPRRYAHALAAFAPAQP